MGSGDPAARAGRGALGVPVPAAGSPARAGRRPGGGPCARERRAGRTRPAGAARGQRGPAARWALAAVPPRGSVRPARARPLAGRRRASSSRRPAREPGGASAQASDGMVLPFRRVSPHLGPAGAAFGPCRAIARDLLRWGRGYGKRHACCCQRSGHADPVGCTQEWPCARVTLGAGPRGSPDRWHSPNAMPGQ
ncbi:unnamed protein product [Prorocentrum cordatum]|uniref:Uncharacterized protein n=2 Tax=Prorocentrum cordatum TaxID=2364126 RepID=A0ABN9RPA3_9DINO|nr:unnamed protein product [Polarella glacialis]